MDNKTKSKTYQYSFTGNIHSFKPVNSVVSSERAFDVAAPKAWNTLPVDIKSTRYTGLFKNQLKTLLFLAAYPVCPGLLCVLCCALDFS